MTIDLPPRYRDPRHLANGGMAAVYAAEDSLLGRRVAVKVLAAHFAEDPAAVHRFQREARAAARVSQHPHVVTIYDVGEHAGRPFIVMELRGGGSLAQVLRAGVPPREEALRWVAEAASALDAAHELDIVHRDVKPGNLLLDSQRRLGVADFGIARLAYESAVTLTGQVLGTAAYLAPEQAAGEGATPASDRYALAVVAHELLTGRRPGAAGATPGELPAAAGGVLERGLARDPAARWESATDFAAALVHAAAPGGEGDPTAVTRPLAGAAAVGAGAVEPTPQRTAPAPVRPPAKRAAPAAGPAAARPPSPPSLRRRGGSRRWLPVALIGVLAALVVVFALASGGGAQPVTRSAAVPGPAPAAAPGEPGGPQQPAEPTAGSSVSALNDQGFALMSQGRYAEAIAPLQQAVEQCGESRETVCAYALYNLGRSLRLAGRPAEAIPVLERRLDYDNQTEVVQAELDAARREAGQGGGEEGNGEEGPGNGRGNGKGKGRGKGEEGDD